MISQGVNEWLGPSVPSKQTRTTSLDPAAAPPPIETVEGTSIWSDRVYLDMSLLTNHHAAAA